MRPQDRNVRIPPVWRGPGQALEEHTAEGIDVNAGVDLPAFDLLGRHVVDGSDELTGSGYAAARLDVLRQTEVRKVCMVLPIRPRLDEDVRRLHVAMDQPPGVRCVQGAGHLCSDPQDPGRSDGVAISRQLLEVRALDIAHRDVEQALCIARVVDRDDVRVGDRSGSPRLTHESLAEALVLGQIRWKQFQRDDVAEPRILGPVHHAHASAAEKRLDAVPGEDRADPRCRRH